MSDKHAIGKVFISHSSKDKKFVRRLAKKIESGGFQVWLDEKELVAGDALSTKISEALDSARVVLVVVSQASVKSKWLSFELNKAADRMVQGQCRVIPVVIDDAPLPASVRGLLYADFASSFAFGAKSLLSALQHEARVRAVSGYFYSRADTLVEEVFGSRSYVSIGGEYRTDNYEVVTIATDAGAEVEIFYETVSDYLGEEAPLTSGWWSEFSDELSQKDLQLALVVTQRPIGFPISGTHESNGRAKFKTSVGYNGRVNSYVVFSDLTGIKDLEDQKAAISDARELLSKLLTNVMRK